MSNLEKLGKQIKYHRTLKGFTQKEMAEKLNVSLRYIGHIENGHRGASLDMQVEICKCLGISMSDLVPVDESDDLEIKEKWIGEINTALRALETEQVGFLKTMVCAFND